MKKSPLFGAFQAPDTNDGHRLGPIQKIDARDAPLSRRVTRSITSSSALARRAACCVQRLARAGFRVVGFEAGPFWDTERDWVSDEAGSHQPLLERPAHHWRREPAGLRREQ